MIKLGKFIIAALLFGVLFPGQDVWAGNQSRSNTFFVGSLTSILNSATDFPFSVYIGDDLTDVVTPIKSVYFTVSGVYTGVGTLDLSINGSSTSLKSFSLANAATPTHFEITYRDESNIVNPVTAGNFSYTFNVAPTGSLAISGFGAKVNVSYQFANTICSDGASVNEKMKTTEQFVGSSNTAINSAIDYPFALYIGDDLTSISTPIKSVYFSVSGVYTGNGSIGFMIDGDAASLKTFNLPNTAAPKPFEIVFRDSAGIISPTTAGSYSHTLNINPVGVIISGLGAVVAETHRYHPPSCGPGYPPFGELTSAVFDSTNDPLGPGYNSLYWLGKLGGPAENQGRVMLRVAASDSSTGPWSYLGSNCAGDSTDWFEMAPDTPVELGCFDQYNNKRYFRYKVRLCADDCVQSGATTPQFDEVVFSISP